MTGVQIRRRFLDYFQSQGHRVVPSSSLVPAHDPTLLFTNAGMNQFKDVFLGSERRDYMRATTSQKCVRAGGKHNDLDNVGFTNRHHTFFEMLGNFSFGDYFKPEAITFAWELLTSVEKGFGIPAERLYATVFTDDDEAHRLWTDLIGLPADRVFRLGEKDNFWAMGDTGPCGPCSELHVDQGAAASEQGHADCGFPCDCGRYVEIWNLVFMQYERDAQGRLTPLPRPSIDTGAGLERLAALLQGKVSNYDSDLFQPLLAAAASMAGIHYGDTAQRDISLRIIADHSRAATFLVHDGVLPGNEGRGYVLRKIMRRGIRHGKLLGIQGNFLHRLVEVVATGMRDAYPELLAAQARIGHAVLAEEERFSRTLALALKELEHTPVQVPGRGPVPLADAMAAERERPQDHAAGRPLLEGEPMFRLYDTFGLPLDVMREIAVERGLVLDEAGFHTAMERQRQRARASWKGGEQATANPVYQSLLTAGKTRFEGYQATASSDCIVLALLRDGQRTARLEPGENGEAILDHTPFYAASGGQVGDVGEWRSDERIVAEVRDTLSPVGGLTVHRVHARLPLQEGDRIVAVVDTERRQATRRNHTATHLLHAALRQTLGEHVKQAGSVVEPGRLRFDFTHYAALAPDELIEIEHRVNREILRNHEVKTEILPLDQALETGAMALFGEKYQEAVRVVTVAEFSKELCGGTHCRRTGDIGLFKILGENSSSAGVRRVEAVTGEGALEHTREAGERLHRLSALLRAAEPELVQSVERLLEQQRNLQRELERLQLKSAQNHAGNQAADRTRVVRGIKVVSLRADHLDRSQLRNLLDEVRSKLGSGVVALGSEQDGKVALLVAVTSDLTGQLQAGKILKALPGISGGGRPELAEAGGKDPSSLDATLEQVYGAVEKLLE